MVHLGKRFGGGRGGEGATASTAASAASAERHVSRNKAKTKALFRGLAERLRRKQEKQLQEKREAKPKPEPELEPEQKQQPSEPLKTSTLNVKPLIPQVLGKEDKIVEVREPTDIDPTRVVEVTNERDGDTDRSNKDEDKPAADRVVSTEQKKENDVAAENADDGDGDKVLVDELPVILSDKPDEPPKRLTMISCLNGCEQPFADDLSSLDSSAHRKKKKAETEQETSILSNIQRMFSFFNVQKDDEQKEEDGLHVVAESLNPFSFITCGCDPARHNAVDDTEYTSKIKYGTASSAGKIDEEQTETSGSASRGHERMAVRENTSYLASVLQDVGHRASESLREGLTKLENVHLEAVSRPPVYDDDSTVISDCMLEPKEGEVTTSEGEGEETSLEVSTEAGTNDTEAKGGEKPKPTLTDKELRVKEGESKPAGSDEKSKADIERESVASCSGTASVKVEEEPKHVRDVKKSQTVIEEKSVAKDNDAASVGGGTVSSKGSRFSLGRKKKKKTKKEEEDTSTRAERKAGGSKSELPPVYPSKEVLRTNCDTADDGKSVEMTNKKSMDDEQDPVFCPTDSREGDSYLLVEQKPSNSKVSSFVEGFLKSEEDSDDDKAKLDDFEASVIKLNRKRPENEGEKDTEVSSQVSRSSKASSRASRKDVNSSRIDDKDVKSTTTLVHAADSHKETIMTSNDDVVVNPECSNNPDDSASNAASISTSGSRPRVSLTSNSRRSESATPVSTKGPGSKGSATGSVSTRGSQAKNLVSTASLSSKSSRSRGSAAGSVSTRGSKSRTLLKIASFGSKGSRSRRSESTKESSEPQQSAMASGTEVDIPKVSKSDSSSSLQVDDDKIEVIPRTSSSRDSRVSSSIQPAKSDELPKVSRSGSKSSLQVGDDEIEVVPRTSSSRDSVVASSIQPSVSGVLLKVSRSDSKSSLQLDDDKIACVPGTSSSKDYMVVSSIPIQPSASEVLLNVSRSDSKSSLQVGDNKIEVIPKAASRDSMATSSIQLAVSEELPKVSRSDIKSSLQVGDDNIEVIPGTSSPREHVIVSSVQPAVSEVLLKVSRSNSKSSLQVGDNKIEVIPKAASRDSMVASSVHSAASEVLPKVSRSDSKSSPKASDNKSTAIPRASSRDLMVASSIQPAVSEVLPKVSRSNSKSTLQVDEEEIAVVPGTLSSVQPTVSEEAGQEITLEPSSSLVGWSLNLVGLGEKNVPFDAEKDNAITLKCGEDSQGKSKESASPFEDDERSAASQGTRGSKKSKNTAKSAGDGEEGGSKAARSSRPLKGKEDEASSGNSKASSRDEIGLKPSTSSTGWTKTLNLFGFGGKQSAGTPAIDAFEGNSSALQDTDGPKEINQSAICAESKNDLCPETSTSGKGDDVSTSKKEDGRAHGTNADKAVVGEDKLASTRASESSQRQSKPDSNPFNTKVEASGDKTKSAAGLKTTADEAGGCKMGKTTGDQDRSGSSGQIASTDRNLKSAPNRAKKMINLDKATSDVNDLGSEPFQNSSNVRADDVARRNIEKLAPTQEESTSVSGGYTDSYLLGYLLAQISFQKHTPAQSDASTLPLPSRGTPLIEIFMNIRNQETKRLGKGYLTFILTEFSKQARTVDRRALQRGYVEHLSEKPRPQPPSPKEYAESLALVSEAMANKVDEAVDDPQGIPREPSKDTSFEESTDQSSAPEGSTTTEEVESITPPQAKAMVVQTKKESVQTRRSKEQASGAGSRATKVKDRVSKYLRPNSPSEQSKESTTLSEILDSYSMLELKESESTSKKEQKDQKRQLKSSRHSVRSEASSHDRRKDGHKKKKKKKQQSVDIIDCCNLTFFGDSRKEDEVKEELELIVSAVEHSLAVIRDKDDESACNEFSRELDAVGALDVNTVCSSDIDDPDLDFDMESWINFLAGAQHSSDGSETGESSTACSYISNAGYSTCTQTTADSSQYYRYRARGKKKMKSSSRKSSPRASSRASPRACHKKKRRSNRSTVPSSKRSSPRRFRSIDMSERSLNDER